MNVMKQNKKLLAWVLSLAMVVGCLTNGGVARAEGEDTGEPSQQEDIEITLDAEEITDTTAVLAGTVSGSSVSLSETEDGKRNLTVSGQAVTLTFSCEEGNSDSSAEGEESDSDSSAEVEEGNLSIEKGEGGYIIKQEVSGLNSGTEYRYQLVMKTGDSETWQSEVKVFTTKYRVSFDSKGGTKVASQLVEKGGKAEEPEVSPTFGYYEFAGWYSEADEKFDFEKKEIEADTKLVAKWRSGVQIEETSDNLILQDESGSQKQEKDMGEPIIPVTYEANKGYQLSEDYLTEIKVTSVTGSAVTLSKPESDAATGAYAATGAGVRFEINVNQLTISGTPEGCLKINLPDLSPQTYKIEYELSGGEWTADAEVPNSYDITRDDITLPEPARIGYEFTGWTNSDSDTTPSKEVTIEKGSTGDRKYIANWKLIQGTIVYTGCEGAANPNQVTSFTIETTQLEILEPTKSSYQFAGWYYQGKKLTDNRITHEMIEAAVKANSDITLEAKWSPIKHSLTFVNGNAKATREFFEYAGVPEKEIQAPSSQEGKIFLGWFEIKDGRETLYTELKAGQINYDITLTAKWADITVPQNEVFVPVNGSGKAVKVTTNINNNYAISYQWKNGSQTVGNADSFVAKADKTGTVNYYCEVTVKRGAFSCTGKSRSVKVTYYKSKITMTLHQSKSVKRLANDILGADRDVSIKSTANKYLQLNKKKKTLKALKYNNKKKMEVPVEVTVGGQKLKVTVVIKLPRPKIKLKKGKRKRYIEGVYRKINISYTNIKGATRVVTSLGKNKNKLKKGPKALNKLKGVKVNIKAGQVRYLQIVAYYGKGKSSKSKVVKLKG